MAQAVRATILIEAQNRARAAFDSLRADLRGAKQELRDMFANPLLKTGLLAGALIGIRREIGEAFRAADAFEASVRKLGATAAISNIPLATLQRLSRELQADLGVSAGQANDLTTEVAKLAAKAGDMGKASAGLRAFLDLGAARGLDAEATLTAVRQSILGIDEGTDKLFGSNPSVLYEQFARSIGTTAGKLTDAQKAQALLTAAIRDGGRVQGEYARFAESAAGQTARLRTNVEDARRVFGQALAPARELFLGVMNAFVNIARGVVQGWQAIGAAAGFFVFSLPARFKLASGLILDTIANLITEIGKAFGPVGERIAESMTGGIREAGESLMADGQRTLDELRAGFDDSVAEIFGVEDEGGIVSRETRRRLRQRPRQPNGTDEDDDRGRRTTFRDFLERESPDLLPENRGVRAMAPERQLLGPASPFADMRTRPEERAELARVVADLRTFDAQLAASLDARENALRQAAAAVRAPARPEEAPEGGRGAPDRAPAAETSDRQLADALDVRVDALREAAGAIAEAARAAVPEVDTTAAEAVTTALAAVDGRLTAELDRRDAALRRMGQAVGADSLLAGLQEQEAALADGADRLRETTSVAFGGLGIEIGEDLRGALTAAAAELRAGATGVRGALESPGVLEAGRRLQVELRRTLDQIERELARPTGINVESLVHRAEVLRGFEELQAVADQTFGSIAEQLPEIEAVTAGVVEAANAHLERHNGLWVQIGANIRAAVGEVPRLADVIASAVVPAGEALASGMGAAFAAIVEGSGRAGQAMVEGIRGAIKAVAREFQRLFVAKAIGAFGDALLFGNPSALAAGAKYLLAASLFAAIAGGSGGGGAGGGTGGGGSSFASNGQALAGAARGELIIEMPAGWGDPATQMDWLVSVLEQATQRKVTVRNR